MILYIKFKLNSSNRFVNGANDRNRTGILALARPYTNRCTTSAIKKMVTSMGFGPMNAAVKGQCVKPLHQLAKNGGPGWT